ncbi:MAG TPA: Crp/Fnr family transcriptional regulator [bacterium]|nr:Crp/Fnr family transcriptional regulator [bacterium]
MENFEHAFPHVNDTLRQVLVGVGERRRYAKGTVLYEEGFPCPLVPLILSGVVRVYKMGETGREITLYRVEPGQMCVLSSTCALAGQDAKLPAVAIAETDVELLAVPAHVFRRLLNEQPELQGYINRTLTERLAEMMMVVDEVAFGRVDLRLAELLLRASKDATASEPGTVNSTHAQLAMELGSAREVVSRLLKDFERQGLVKLGRGRIEVVNPEGLRGFIAQKSG